MIKAEREVIEVKGSQVELLGEYIIITEAVLGITGSTDIDKLFNLVKSCISSLRLGAVINIQESKDD